MIEYGHISIVYHNFIFYYEKIKELYYYKLK